MKFIDYGGEHTKDFDSAIYQKTIDDLHDSFGTETVELNNKIEDMSYVTELQKSNPDNFAQSVEKVVFARPDIIIVSSMKRGGNFENIRDRWKQWKDIPAVKHDRIYIINSDLTDHSSPRIVDGLEELVRIIHPAQTTGNSKNE